MPHFSATQYKHFRNRFDTTIKNKIAEIEEPIDLSNDDMVTQILAGKATFNKGKILPKNGSCSYHLDRFLEFFNFPGESVRTAKRLTYNKKVKKLRKKLRKKLDDLLEQYVVGLITAEELRAEIKKIEK